MKVFSKFLVATTFILIGWLASSFTANAAPANLIQNPSLETASANPSVPLNWFKGGWGANTSVFTYPVPGFALTALSAAAKVEITNYTSGDAKWYFADVPVTGGKNYTLHNFYKSNVTTQAVARYQTSTGVQYQLLGTHAPASD